MRKKKLLIDQTSPFLTCKEIMQQNIAKQLFNIKYDQMEFNDLLSGGEFIESYNKTSRKRGREM